MKTKPVVLLACLAAAAAHAAPLGDGYRDAKWGMSPAEVQAVLPGTATELRSAPDGDRFLLFDLGEARRLTCWFFEDRFYLAVYDPGIGQADELGAAALLLALRKKYGAEKPLDGYVDDLGRPLVVLAWDDGTTEIQYQLTRLSQRMGSSVRVTYRSKALARERDAARSRKPRDPREELESKAREFQEDI